MFECGFFDPKTGFVSSCVTRLLGAGIALASAGVLALEIPLLWSHQRGPASVWSLIDVILALVNVVLWLTIPLLNHSSPEPTEWVIAAGAAVAAFGHWSQVGRVKVGLSGLLCYWLGSILVTLNMVAYQWYRGSSDMVVIYLVLLAISVIELSIESSPNAHKPTTEQKYGDRTTRMFDAATLFEKVSMGFVTPMLRRGTTAKLDRENIPLPPFDMNAGAAHELLTEALGRHKGSRFRLLLSILDALKGKIAAMLVVDVIAEFIWLFEPLVLSTMFRLLQNYIDGTSKLFPCVYFGMMVGLMPIVESALFKISNLYQSQIDVTSRASLTGTIYRKALRLAPSARKEYDTGKIVNLVSVDTNFILTLSDVVIMVVTCPIMLILALYQLWLLVGMPVVAGGIVLGLFSAFTGYTSKLSMPIYPAWMAQLDKRTKATSNILRNIKSLKLYAWEKPYHDRITAQRDGNELMRLRDFLRITAVNNGIWAIADDLVAIAIFVSFLYWQMGSLSPDIVFPTLMLLTIVSIQTGMLPQVVTMLMQILAANRRINELFNQDEQSYANYYRPTIGAEPGNIDVNDATISWSNPDDPAAVAIHNLSLQASAGDLVCITGRVGTGKTALLKALAGELSVSSGSVTVSGRIAYCGQEPWLQNGSLRDNIVFGQSWDEVWYHEVIRACALDKDVEQMPKKHETEVGERGISLSGGQKARVALARAIYSRADIYLLDDVLSAVDEHVARQLIDSLFTKDGLLSSRTVILATNYVKILGHASLIVAVQDGKVLEQLSIQELLDHRNVSPTYRLIREFGHGSVDSLEAHDRKGHVRARNESQLGELPLVDAEHLAISDGRRADEENEYESAEKATSALSVYKRYLRVLSKPKLAVGLGLTILSVATINSISVWLGVISGHRFTSLGPAEWYIGLYLITTVLNAVLSIISFYWFLAVLSIAAAKQFHAKMLWRVMHSPMSFFDTTPLGRILNRFTGDINLLDTSLPQSLYTFMRNGLNIVLLSIYIIGATPLTIIAIIPMFFLVQRFRKLYVPTSRQISRLVKAANSPMLAQIEETLKGATVVRGFGRTEQFIDLYKVRQNNWIELRFVQVNLQGWLTWRIQCVTTVLRLSAIMSSLVLVVRGHLSVASIGVILQFTNKIGMIVANIISQVANLEVAAVGLDRIVEYIDLPQEAPPHIAETEPAGDWPNKGLVEFIDYSCRYNSTGADVLKNLHLSVKAGEKIGIVGRTGSGKSTLTLALFRILEASKGNINIDRINTSTLGLSDLRSHLAIIPQDAQIFSGSVRENLDPFGTIDDARLWQVLELCHLKQHFEAHEGLDTDLSGDGDNLSKGQSQLVCLGRALLHDSKVLVLDEATASVDVETDHVLQQTIRKEFADRTIFTVAHRLNTIMDSDKILVLDKGIAKEFDTPNVLLENKGLFWSLVNAHIHGKIDL